MVLWSTIASKEHERLRALPCHISFKNIANRRVKASTISSTKMLIQENESNRMRVLCIYSDISQDIRSISIQSIHKAFQYFLKPILPCVEFNATIHTFILYGLLYVYKCGFCVRRIVVYSPAQLTQYHQSSPLMSTKCHRRQCRSACWACFVTLD